MLQSRCSTYDNVRIVGPTSANSGLHIDASFDETEVPRKPKLSTRCRPPEQIGGSNHACGAFRNSVLEIHPGP